MSKDIQNNNISKVFGAGLLVAGMSIGGSTISIHLVAQSLGLKLTLLLFVSGAIVMYSTGVLLSDVCRAHPDCHNFFRLTEVVLGKRIRDICVVMLMMLFYTLTSFYIQSLLPIIGWGWVCVIAVLLSIALVSGTSMIDKLNRIVMYSLFVTFVILLLLLFRTADVSNIHLALPQTIDPSIVLVIIAAFGFQIIVPSIAQYLNHDRNDLRKAMFQGVTIILTVYGLYTLFLVMNLSLDGLSQVNNVEQLAQFISLRWGAVSTTVLSSIHELTLGFFLTAVVSSFIGVSKSLYDLWLDIMCLKQQPSPSLSWMTVVMILLPSWLMATYFTSALLLLKVAGLFVVVLNIVLPTLLSYIDQGQLFSFRKRLWHLTLFILSILLLIVFFT